jgi:hypothetical protein
MLTGVLSCSGGLEAAGGFRFRAGAPVLLMTSEADGAGSSGAVPLESLSPAPWLYKRPISVPIAGAEMGLTGTVAAPSTWQ